MKISALPPLTLLFISLFFYLLSSTTSVGQKLIDSSEIYLQEVLTPNENSDLTKALNYFKRKYEEDLKKKDTFAAVKKLRISSMAQAEMGALYESENSAIKAMKLLDALIDNPETRYAKMGVYADLGRIYRGLENPEIAIEYYDKGKQMSQNTFDSIVPINNKGNAFLDMGDYKRAQKEYALAYKMSLTLTDTLLRARILDNLGYAQSKMGDPEGLENMLHALDLKLSLNDLTAVYSSYRHLALYYQDQHKKNEASKYAEKAYHIAKKINSPSYLENSLTNLLKIRGDSVANEFISLNDSLKVAKLKNQNKYAAMQYDISKEREKTEATKLLQEKEKRKTQAFQFLGILLVLAGLAVYLIQRARNKKNTLLQIYQTETRISKKVHDEVANDVYHLMTKIQGNNSSMEEPLLDDLEEIYKKTRDISKENSAIEIRENFNEQLTDLLFSYGNERVKITTHNISKIEWKSVSEIKKTVIYRVLQELMTNMRKHSQATQVLIGFQQNGNKLQIKYVDNGVGCELKNKNGLGNTENRIKAINGTIIFDSTPQKGFKSIINI